MEININGKVEQLYPIMLQDSEELCGIFYKTGTLNGFFGLDISHIQVLKSAAGFYIGALCKDNYGTEEEPNYQWAPNFRDSQYYWATREEAETALIIGNYEVKF